MPPLKKRKILIIAGIVIALLLCLPIKIKQAVNIELGNIPTRIDSMVEQNVSLLCEYSSQQETDPDQRAFIVTGIAIESGIFVPILNEDGETISAPSLYVSPNTFIGAAIKKYNYGFRNQFVFHGVLHDGSGAANYEMTLKRWDIVYPIYHWELYPYPHNEDYKNNLYVFDYWIP